MLSYNLAKLVIVCAALAPFASAFDVAYSVYPDATLGFPACGATPNESGTFASGTTGAPGCQNIPTSYYGQFKLAANAPVGCVLNFFTGTNCGGTQNAGLIIPIPLEPGVQTGCATIYATQLSITDPKVPGMSLQVVCPA
ncbi:unnamed protein product [Peniophora sp. CBMAI 1063]|nr:unnamed protein product [Peniophora sp. CBMAI 1063]